MLLDTLVPYQDTDRSQVGNDQDCLPVALQFLLLSIHLHIFLVDLGNALLEIVCETAGGEVESHCDDTEEPEEDQL